MDWRLGMSATLCRNCVRLDWFLMIPVKRSRAPTIGRAMISVSRDRVVYRLAPDAASRSADDWSVAYRIVYTDAEGLLTYGLITQSLMSCAIWVPSASSITMTCRDKSWRKLKVRCAQHWRPSVSQLWSVVWKVVRDAASLANREYYNRPKAAATIPGKIWRNLEKVQRESIELKAWSRPEQHPAGNTGDGVGRDLGVDENTSGHRVSPVTWLTGQSCSPTVEGVMSQQS